MDLRGSLVDTNLRIYPTKSFRNFMESIPLEEEMTENLCKFLGRDRPVSRKTKVVIDINKKLMSIQLSEQEIAYLDKIMKIVQENDKCETLDDRAENKNSTKSENEKNPDCSSDQKVDQNNADNDSQKEESKTEQKQKVAENHEPYLTTADIDWLYQYLQKLRSREKNTPYLNELFAGSKVEMPHNEVLKRNPVLEARCVKLRAQQEAREYRQMTKGVDNVRMKFPEDSIAYQIKQMNRQLIAILQFLISIFAGFLFGFKGLEWMIGNLDFGFRLLMGVMCALVIALAEIYFLAKKLNEELTIPETVQLGGPPKFVDETLNLKSAKKSVKSEKQHQD